MVLELREYQPVAATGLTVQQVRALQSCLPSLRADFQGGDAWTLTAGHDIGFLRVDDLQVHVHPKIDMQTLLYLLTCGVEQLQWQPNETTVAPVPRPVDAFAHFLAAATRRATRSGVLQGYRERDEALRVVRGQWRVNEQIRRHHGRLLPVEVRDDDYTEDITENQTIATALQVLRRTTHELSARRELTRALAPFSEGIDPLPLWQYAQPPAISWTPLNRHYRGAVELARLALRQGAITHHAGDVRTSGIVININTVFEQFVRRALRRALDEPGSRIWKASRADGLVFDQAGTVRLEPDILWSRHSKLCLVADAKYKRLKPRGFEHADLYQMHAYCSATGTRAGLLIYGEGDVRPHRHSIPGSNTTISVMALNLSGSITEIQSSIESVAVEARQLLTP
jgi:5-methylcytosine-specific restriction enzyme subunit McrC